MSASLYPLFLDLRGRRVLIVGGGKVAWRRFRRLPAGAQVRVVAPRALPGFRRRAEVLSRPARLSDVAWADFVITASEDAHLNARLARRALRLRKLVCAAHDARQGNAQVPALAKAGPFRIAISSGGAGPAASAFLKRWLESRLRGSAALRRALRLRQAGQRKRSGR